MMTVRKGFYPYEYYEIPCHLQCKLYLYDILVQFIYIYSLFIQVFHLPVTQFGLLNLLHTSYHIYFQWFLNFLWMKDVALIQKLLIAFVSRIFHSRHFSHSFFSYNRGNCVTIENASIVFFSNNDYFPFQLLFQRYG